MRKGVVALALLLALAPVAQAVTFGAQQTANGPTKDNVRTVSAPAGIAAGHLLLAQVSSEDGDSVSITPPTGWTLKGRIDNGGNVANAVYYKVATANEPSSYTFGFSKNTKSAVAILRYVDVNTTTPFDGTVGSVTASSTTLVLPSITTTTANARVVAFLAHAATSSFTPPAGMTERYDSAGPVTIAAADAAQASAGPTGTKTFTAANSARLAGLVLAIRTAPVPAVSLDRASSSAWEANGTVRFWANLSVASQLPVSVPYTVAGTATGGGVDFTLASGTLSFAAGQTSKGLNVTVVNDAVAEANETIVIALGAPANATAGAVTSATHAILNDDTTVGFASATSSAAEGAGSASVAVTLASPTGRDVTVAYAATSGNATGGGADYTLATGTLAFAPWESTKPLAIAIAQDALDEWNEGVVLTLSSPTNALLGTSTHTLTIADDDATPSLSWSAASVTVAESASPTLTVALSAASGRPVSVAYATTAGTAAAPSDFAAASGTLAFAPGETTKPVALALVQDTLDELDESFTIALSSPQNAALSVATQTVTISDDDAAPLVRFASSSSSGSESGALPHPVVSLSSASGLPVRVSVAVTGGTATSGADHTGGSATLTIPAGSTSASVAIAAVNDAVQEGDETVVLSLSAPLNATVGPPSTHTLTILDDEAPVTVRFAQTDASALEASGAQTATVVLSGVSASTITMAWSVGGTATGGSDHTASGGTLAFAPGETTKTISFSLTDDEAVEPDETLVLTLANGNAHIFTILNDDAPYPVVGFATTAVSLAEAAASPAIVISLSAASARAATVAYAIGGTASAGADFTLAAGTLTFAPGETSKSVAYTVVDDATVEPDETIVVTLSSPTRATIGAGTFTRTILNDDLPPPVAAFALASSTVAESAASASLRVQLDHAASSAVTVGYSATGGTASGEGVDYALAAGTLTFEAGETAKDVVVLLVDDALVEPSETIVVTLAAGAGTTLGATSAHTLTLTSDDAAAITLAFSASSSSVAEAAGTTTLTVLASAGAAEDFDVDYAVTGGTASADADFSLASGTLTFAAGETSKSIVVALLDDATFEPGETVVVALSNPTLGALGSPASHVLTIANDDAQPSTFTFASSTGSAYEAAGDVAIVVSLAPASASAASVAYAVTGGTASAGTDFTLASGTLAFAAGETSKTITLRLLDDAAIEATETVVLRLSDPSGAQLGTDEHIVSILNDDAVLPMLQWNASASTAGEGTGSAIVRAYVSASSASPITVAYAVTGGSATGGGADYTLASGTLTFAPGETSRALVVALVDDALVEGDETLVVTLASPTNAQLGPQTSHTLTILEDDVAPTTVIDVAATPVLADGGPATGATWGGWNAEPGATNVASTNYLKLVNAGTLADPRVVVSFATSGFVGASDASFVIPTSSNLQFAWWEDATPGSSAPNEGTFTWGATQASPSVTLQFSGTGRVIYVAYRIVQMPDVLLQQGYGGSFTVTEL